jgi:hypothetical protein
MVGAEDVAGTVDQKDVVALLWLFGLGGLRGFGHGRNVGRPSGDGNVFRPPLHSEKC